MRSKIKRQFFILMCLVTMFAQITFADDIKTISNYLQNLKSVSMDFVQFDSRSEKAEGKLIMVKPHKFRCNYYEPYPLLIVGNKSEIALYDYELENTTRINKDENIFNFLFTEGDDWEKEFKLEQVIDVPRGKLYSIYHRTSDRTINLVMNNHPFRLRQIIIDESDGNVIEVTISNIKNITSTKKGLFSIPNPDVFGAPKRIGAEEIEKWIE